MYKKNINEYLKKDARTLHRKKKKLFLILLNFLIKLTCSLREYNLNRISGYLMDYIQGNRNVVVM